MKLCFKLTFKLSLVKHNSALYSSEFDSQPNSVYISPIEAILKEFMIVIDSNTCEKARMQLLFQSLFNVSYPRFKEDKGAAVHGIAMLVIEFICFAMEHPPYIGQEVMDGVRVRPAITKICNYLRNYMYYQTIFPTSLDRELFDLWCASPIIPTFCAYVGKMVTPNANWKDLCEFVNEQLDDYYMGTDSVPIVKEIEFVTRSFAARSALLKPLFTTNVNVNNFLDKNASPDFSKLAMKFD